MLPIEQDLIEIPLSLYCEIRGISKKTAYTRIKKQELEMISKNRNSYILVKKEDIFILGDYKELDNNLNKRLNLIQRRRNKRIVSNLKKIQNELNKVLICLDRDNQ